MIVKQKCPGCGRMVDALWSHKKSFDSCAFCNPNIKGKGVGQILHEIQERRKREDNKKKRRTK